MASAPDSDGFEAIPVTKWPSPTEIVSVSPGDDAEDIGSADDSDRDAQILGR
jgi:hypothetical protein